MARKKPESFAAKVLKTGQAQASERRPAAKAYTVGGNAQPSNVMQGVDELENAFRSAGAIEPPYNPSTITSLFEMSNSLRQNVDAYATNIDSFGHSFKPVVDTDAADADQRIAQAMYAERLAAAIAQHQAPAVGGAAKPPIDVPLMPNPAEVKARKDQLIEDMRAEKARVEHFFEFCCGDISFVTFRRQLRQDFEMLGNAYLEVLRNAAGEIAEFTYIPAFTVRLLALDSDRTDYEAQQKQTELSYGAVKRSKRFRGYVQVLESKTVHFKEFEDPRVISRVTGKPLAPDKLEFEKGDGPATEIIHLRIHSSRTAYGVPRWIGNLLSVFGSRQAEEVNHTYFENKSVPPLAVLVSGGVLAQESVKRMTSYIEDNIKGKGNFHKILVIEGVNAQDPGFEDGPTPQVKVELKPLTEAQQKDALFKEYDERNMDKVGMSFRLPRMLRGDIRDFNRATADAALEFAEQQVFAPERAEFDWLVNRRIFPQMGVRYWKFESNTPTTKDPVQLTKILVDMVDASIITPGEARELAQSVFNKELPLIDAEWAKQPVALTLAGLSEMPDIPDMVNPDATPDAGNAKAPFSTEGDTEEKADMTTADLLSGGLNRGGSRRGRRSQNRLLRIPQPNLTTKAVIAQLLQLRDACIDNERGNAHKRFIERRIEEIRSEEKPVDVEDDAAE